MKEIFLFSETSLFFWDPFSNLFDGYRSSFSDVDQPGREADHLVTPSEMAKKACSYSFTLPCGFMTLTGTNVSFNWERKVL
jgi:hypothetical protein